MAAELAWPLWNGRELPAEYAARVGLPATLSLDCGNRVTLETVLVPPGKFIMGTPPAHKPDYTVQFGQRLLATGAIIAFVLIFAAIWRAFMFRRKFQFSLRYLLALTLSLGIASGGAVHWKLTAEVWRHYEAAKNRPSESSEWPPHEVTISAPFYVGKFEVTRGEYQAVTERTRDISSSPAVPMEKVSWDDANRFCMLLTELGANRKSYPNEVLNCRLPTEAEWEYACRAGTDSCYYTGDKSADLLIAGHSQNNAYSSAPVGRLTPNAFGLFDMHGNAWEWCSDRYGRYPAQSVIDPSGSIHGDCRVLRGGSYRDDHNRCRSAYRDGNHSVFNYCNAGFRIVLPVSPAMLRK